MYDKRKAIFNKVVNPLLLKYLTDPHNGEHSIAKNIPIKYLKYFKAISKNGKGHKLRYRYRGVSKPNYRRVSSFCHMNFADTFAIYYR
jgi:hypothetical protein